jgi:hypothetical protein
MAMYVFDSQLVLPMPPMPWSAVGSTAVVLPSVRRWLN